MSNHPIYKIKYGFKYNPSNNSIVKVINFRYENIREYEKTVDIINISACDDIYDYIIGAMIDLHSLCPNIQNFEYPDMFYEYKFENSRSVDYILESGNIKLGFENDYYKKIEKDNIYKINTYVKVNSDDAEVLLNSGFEYDDNTGCYTISDYIDYEIEDNYKISISNCIEGACCPDLVTFDSNNRMPLDFNIYKPVFGKKSAILYVDLEKFPDLVDKFRKLSFYEMKGEQNKNKYQCQLKFRNKKIVKNDNSFEYYTEVYKFINFLIEYLEYMSIESNIVDICECNNFDRELFKYSVFNTIKKGIII